MIEKPGLGNFKKMSRGLTVALAVVVALAAFNVTIPPGQSAASNWRFAFTHLTILLHIIAAAIVVVVACIAVIGAVRQGSLSFIALSVAGLAFVLLAFTSGVDYVGTLRKDALNYMSIGWAGAIVAYGTGWYLSRRKEHQGKNPL